VKQSRQTSIVPCPRHKAPDHIRPVSVVYTEDALSLLSPGPVLKAATRLAWAGTSCGVAGAVAIWIGNVVGAGAANIGLLCAIICFAYALALYGWAWARRARLIRVERGMPNAMALWRVALYCDRCDGVFFTPGAAGVETRGLMPATEFQRLVWSAGGYGDLRPAVGDRAVSGLSQAGDGSAQAS
jgi:hypothetical protein